MNIYYKAKRSVSHLRAHLLETIKREGFAQFVVKSCRKVVRLAKRDPSLQEIEQLEFDRRFGTNTATSIPAWKLSDISSPNRVHAINYVPSQEKDVLMLFGMLPIRAKEYVFVDLGSGKGKVLLLAAEYGFKRIVGIEFSPSLHEIAQSNIERYMSVSTRNCQIESVCQDAADYAIPSEKLVVFLYGPFHEPVFRSVVTRLRQSLKDHDRPVFVVNFGSPLANAIRKIDFLYPLPGKAGQWIYSNKQVANGQDQKQAGLSL